MNIKWDGKGNFAGDFTPEQRKDAEDHQAKQRRPHLTDLFKLMPDGSDPYDSVESELPLTCDCSRCDNILEAPLMRGSKQCCADSLKQMMYDWMDENSRHFKIDGPLDLLAWAVWLQKWVEYNNDEETKNTVNVPVVRIVGIEKSLGEFEDYLLTLQEEEDEEEKKDRDPEGEWVS